jgi:hypothetical protein
MSHVYRNLNARIQHANPLYFGGDRKRILDPVKLLNDCASIAHDAGFWICISAAAHVNGYNLKDKDPSTVATYLRKSTIRAESRTFDFDNPPFDSPEVAGE